MGASSIAIDRVRNELLAASGKASTKDLQFPVGEVTLEFQVGFTKEGGLDGGVNIHILEIGASGKYAKESVQKVTVVLRPPVDANGNPISVSDTAVKKPK